jgi:hypothetical protein
LEFIRKFTGKLRTLDLMKFGQQAPGYTFLQGKIHF